MNSLHFLAETKFFGLALTPWKIIGLSGSIIFGLRFLIQWIASERARKSVIPFGFWECSAVGSFCCSPTSRFTGTILWGWKSNLAGCNSDFRFKR
jgi:lipid-A-disaccharide synthase-like uncharacterized protein